MSNEAAIALNVNEQTLNALQVAGRFFPVFSVAIAAGVALSILEITQMMKANREEFIAIGMDSCFIVETVVQRVQECQNGQIVNNPAMLRHTDMLVADLRHIEKRVRRVQRQSRVKKIFRRQRGRGVVQDCRERIMHAMMLFGFQYDVEIHKQLAGMHNLLITILGTLSYSPSLQAQPRLQWQIPSPSPHVPPPQLTQGMNATLPSNPTGSPTRMGFESSQNTQNYRSPGVGHALVIGNVSDTRDNSINVFGTGNTINFSFAQ